MLKVRIVVKVKLYTLYQGFVACNEMVGSGMYISGWFRYVHKWSGWTNYAEHKSIYVMINRNHYLGS